MPPIQNPAPYPAPGPVSAGRLIAWLAVLPPLFWAGNFVLGRAVHADIPPLALSFWRWALALAVLLPFTWRAVIRQWGLIRAHWPMLGLLAVLGVTNYNTFAYIGLGQTTATNAVLLGAATPLIIVALSWTLLGQRPGVAGVSGLVLSLAGVAVIVSQGEPRRLADFSLNPGDLWILAAALDWALYSIWLRYRPAGLDPLVFLTVLVALGCLPLAALYAWDLASGNRFAVSMPNLAALAYVAVLPSVIAYVIWNRAVAELGANRTGQYIHLMPVFGALLAWLLLGERPGWHHALGFGLIAAGIVLGGRAAGQRPRGS